MRRLACWLLLVLCTVWASAHAAVLVPQDLLSLPLRPHVEVLEDPTGKLGIEEVEALARAGAFRRAAGVGDLNLGFTPSAWWLRLEMRVESKRDLPTLLEVAYPLLDRVDFHAFDRDRRVHLVAGDLLPFGVRPWPHRHLVFPLRLEPGQASVVYLRVVSRGSLTVPVKLWEARALHAHDQTVYAAHALYIGMLLALGIYNLLLYVSIRDRVYLTYVASTAALALGMLSTLGLGSQFLWPDSPLVADRAPLLGFALYGFFALTFMREFLQVRAWAPRQDQVLQGMALASLAIAIAGTLLPGGALFVMAMAVLGSSAALLAIGVGILALVRRRPGARMFVLASAIFQVGLIAYGLRTLDLLPTNVLTSYGLQWGSVIEMMLLALALAARIQALRFAKEQAQAEALQARQATVQALEDAEKRLEHRIGERTAELAQANDRLRASQEELSRLALHDGLTGLPNRAHLEEHLERVVSRCERTGSACAVLVIDLDGFKAVNDTRGHAMGDLLLKAVAQRLSSQVRAGDMVARVGGDEFVVVFEPVPGPEMALTLSAKMLAALGEPFDVAGESASVGGSIGIALAPAQGRQPSALLDLADRAMYEAKRLGKGRCVLAPTDIGLGLEGSGRPVIASP
jgi:diguanylate cyclase (GGDEF)-like protein